MPPIITDIGTTVAGGTFSVANVSGVAEINAFWMQQISLNQPLPQFESYSFPTGQAEFPWGEMYINILQNLKRLSEAAEANGNHSYGVIAKVLTAYTLGVTTDMWGDIPYTEAFEGNLHPKYDKQEDIYNIIFKMLDSAIVENQLPPGNLTPGADDFLYLGDMSKWEKFAYALKARHYMHLTKAPGHTAAAQAALALDALTHAFTGTDDEATLNIYSDAAGHESPWFKNTEIGQGGVVLAKPIIDSLVGRSDPRLPIIANKGSQGTYLGRESSSDVVPDVTIYSTIADYYAGPSSPLPILPYSELEFIKAEATFYVSGAAAAQPIYQQAIKDNMVKLGLNLTSPAVSSYLARRGTLTAEMRCKELWKKNQLQIFYPLKILTTGEEPGFRN